MNSRHFVRSVGIVWMLLSCAALSGCGGANGNGVEVSDKRTDGKSLSSDDEAAADFVSAKLAEHWVKGPDGWTTQFQQRNVMGQLMPDRQPNMLYQQVRQLSFTIAPDNVTEAMKLNGTDYRVSANFKKSPVRFYQLEADYQGPQGWSNWEDHWSMTSVQIVVERRNGKWLISDSNLFEGVKPDPASIPSSQ